MNIVNKKGEKNIKLEVGDILHLRNSNKISYIGKYRMICETPVDNYYRLVALDTNTVIGIKGYTMEEIYEQYKDDIVRVIKSDEIEIQLK